MSDTAAPSATPFLVPAPTVAADCRVSIVVPCLNEELVIGEFVEWCKTGLASAGVSGEVLIVDSSEDRSAEIAAQHGARVLKTPRRGLGRAYIDALPHIRGQYVILGDCDLTYDFRELKPFIEQLDAGHEYVMGSRLRGHLEPGAMPPLHRYFGTPLTTWALNFMYGTRFTDIHCGMRALTRDALLRLKLESQSWEYASEMVLKAARLKLRTAEVPIKFYRDRAGRLSHHKRMGWWSPWLAGWENLRAMFLYAPDFFLNVPGALLLVVGLILTTTLAFGPRTVCGIGFNLHWMLLGLTFTVLGYSAIQLSLLIRAFYNFSPEATARWRRRLTYNRGVGLAAVLGLGGAALDGFLLATWIIRGLHLRDFSYGGVYGLLLIILGFQTFTFTLLFLVISKRREGGPA